MESDDDPNSPRFKQSDPKKAKIEKSLNEYQIECEALSNRIATLSESVGLLTEKNDKLSNMINDVKTALDDGFTCPICKHIAIESIVSSCGHIICEFCRHQMEDDNLLSCGACNQMIQKTVAFNDGDKMIDKITKILSPEQYENRKQLKNIDCATVSQFDGRVRRELIVLQHNNLENNFYSVEPINDSLTKFNGKIKGPVNTPYESGVFTIEIQIPRNYPFMGPLCRFITKVWHPNISPENGSFYCLDELRGFWCPGMGLESALLLLHTLMAEPQMGNTVNDEAAKQYVENRELFERTAKKFTESYANEIQWNPLTDASSTIAPLTLLRIKKDLKEFYKEKMELIFVVPHESDISNVHALIIGPEGTPYDGGFFYFCVKFTSDYPIKPPKVILKTTDSGKVRFNPNLYSTGKVCLSILGTWEGPRWDSQTNLTVLLLSIQSLMNEEPYYNEPVNTESRPKESKKYNEIIAHETFRVAVIQMLEDGADTKDMPQPLRDIMRQKFIDNYDKYEKSLMSKQSVSGSLTDLCFSLGHRQLTYQYPTLLGNLKRLKQRFDITDSPSAGITLKGDNAKPASNVPSYVQMSRDFIEKEVFDADVEN